MPSTYIPKKRKNEAIQESSFKKQRYGSPLSRTVTTASFASGGNVAPESSKMLEYDDMDDDNDINDEDDDDLGEFQVQDEELGGTMNSNGSKSRPKEFQGKSSQKNEDNEGGGIGSALAALGGLGIPGLTGDISSSGSGSRSGSKPDKKDTERQRLLMQAFDDGQMARYEAFRRANVSKGSVKKLANAVLGQSIPAPVATALCGLSKVFIGELVETARQIQHTQNRKSYYELKAKMDKEIEKENKNKNPTVGKNNSTIYKKGSSLANDTSAGLGFSNSSSLSAFPFFDTSLGPVSSEPGLNTLDIKGIPAFGIPDVNPLAGASSSTSTLPDGPFGPDPLSGGAPLLDVLGMKEGINQASLNNPNNLVYPPVDDEEAEKAIELLDRQPLKPEHLREAWRMYKKESGTVPEAQWRRQGGDGDGKMFR